MNGVHGSGLVFSHAWFWRYTFENVVSLESLPCHATMIHKNYEMVFFSQFEPHGPM